MRRVFPIMFLFCALLPACGQIGVSPQPGAPGVRLHGRNPADVAAAQKSLLASYCRLDFEGARLDPEGWARIKPYTSLRTNPDYQQVLIVSRYDVVPHPDQPSTVTVNYRVLAIFDLNEGYSTLNMNSAAEFRTQEQNDELLIVGMSSPLPRVSPQAAVNWMKARLADSQLPDSERIYMENALKQLGRLVPQARPATAPAASSATPAPSTGPVK